MLEDKQLSHWRFYHHLQRRLLWVLPHHPSYNIHMKMGDLIGMYLKPHWDVSQATKVCLCALEKFKITLVKTITIFVVSPKIIKLHHHSLYSIDVA